jgi:hypothetical protein
MTDHQLKGHHLIVVIPWQPDDHQVGLREGVPAMSASLDGRMLVALKAPMIAVSQSLAAQ